MNVMQLIKASWVLLAMLLGRVSAADIPTLGSDPKSFNMAQCIRDSSHDCIRAACIVNSPTNCPSQCKKNAINKCHSLAGQQLLKMD